MGFANFGAYKSILQTDDSKKISLETNVRFERGDLRDQFKHAAKTDIITPEFIDSLTGEKIALLRSTPGNTAFDNGEKIHALISGDTEIIGKKFIDRMRFAKYTPDDAAQVETAIHNIVDKTKIDENFLRDIINERDTQARLAEGFLIYTFRDGKRDELDAADIVRKITRAEPREPDPADLAQLDQLAGAIARDSGKTKDEILKEFTGFKQTVRDFDKNDITPATYQEYIDCQIYQAKNGGDYFKIPDALGPGRYLNIPDLKDAAALNALLFDGEKPNKKPPGTLDQWEFIFALHETEHVSQPRDMSKQAMEIDADQTALHVMNEIGSPPMRDYYLRWRMVRSFTSGFNEGGADDAHDTATFLRIYKATGQQLDMDKFHAEKHDLLEKIGTKIGIKNPKTADIMGATRDLLKEDARQKDPDKKLSAVQHAEAETFLKDANALGFKANPDYPRPQTKTEAKPGEAPAPPAVPGI